MLSSISGTLNKLGFHDLRFATSGEQGLECLLEYQVSLIIMEWNLPKMGGLDFVEHIKSSKYRDIPILMITANATREVVNTALRAGVDEYLPKPLDPKRLKEALEIMI